MKNLCVAFIVLVLFTTLVAGCSKKPSTTSSGANGAPTSFTVSNPATQKYVMVTFWSGISYWKAALTGFQQAAAQLGVQTQFTGTNSGEASDEASVLSTVASQHPAGIIVSPINTTALNQTINQIVASGIPVITYDSDAPGSNRAAFLGTNGQVAGSVAADTLAKLINNQGNVVLECVTGEPTSDLRQQGFETEMKQYPNIHIVATENGNNDPETVATQIGTLMQKYNLSGVFSDTANMGFGVANAVSAANKVGLVKIVAMDRDAETLAEIQKGVIQATMVQGSYIMGYWGLLDLYALHNNLSSPLSANSQAAGVDPVPPEQYTGVTVVTKDNLQDFMNSKY
jgi:ribose transport system substrate-binding protein